MKKKHLEEYFNLVFHDKYKFSDFLELDIQQQSKQHLVKHKVVYAPSKQLKSFQGFLNSIIFENIPLNINCVFSYQKGKNTLDAIYPHKNSIEFYKTDIYSFFESITKKDVETIISNNKKHIPILDLEEKIENILNITTLHDQLPRGFATSPSISNIYLTEFDNKIEKFSKKDDLIYSRYADDIIISSKSQLNIKKINEEIERIFIESYQGKLKINSEKSKHLKKGQKLNLLGINILPNQSLTIDKKIKNTIEVGIHLYLNNKQKLAEIYNNNIDDAIKIISGKLNYAKTIDDQYIVKLKRKYGSAVIDKLIHIPRKR